MSYVIEKNKFASKCKEYADKSTLNSHGIIYRQCNFRCRYCELRNRPNSDFIEYDAVSFDAEVRSLLAYGKNFKFSGGEPCLNPNLLRDLRIVRQYGGLIYLDTNGSKPDVLQLVLEEGLVDVVGLSLKGLTRQEATRISGVQNETIVWDRVWRSIEYSASCPNVRTIITSVVTNQTKLDTFLQGFSAKLAPYPNVYLKINNLMENSESQKSSLFAVDKTRLQSAVQDFLEQNPQLVGKLILITSDKAVGNFSEISFH